jgi:tetratricopeptide (TPR) repeat protein
MLRNLIVGISMAAGAAGLVAVSFTADTAVAAEKEKKEKEQTVSAKVHKPLKAAQEAMNKEDWPTALAKVREAQAVPDRTPFDDYQISEFLAFIAVKQGDYAAAAPAFEAVLNSGFAKPESIPDRVRQLAQLNFQIKNYEKAVEYGKRWIEQSGGKEPDAYVLTGQAQYLLDDNKGSIETIQGAIDSAKATGEPIKEQWLEIVLSAYDRMDDQAGVVKTLEELTAAYPNPTRWKQLTDQVYASPDNDDRSTLEIHRLRNELGVIDRPDDYVEMADIAAAVGIPGEAVKAMEKALAMPGMDAKDKERRTARLAELKKSADSDRKSLPGLEKEAATAKTGEADYALGVGYLSYDQTDKAVEAIKRGIQKGGLKRPDEAQLTLGRALLKANQKDAAKQAFETVPQGSKLARTARLWAIYASQQA